MRIALPVILAGLALSTMAQAQFSTDWSAVDRAMTPDAADAIGGEAGDPVSRRRDAALPALVMSPDSASMLPACALETEPLLVWDTEGGAWVTTSYDLGCVFLGIEGSVAIDADFAEEIGAAPLDLAPAIQRLDENDSEDVPPVVEISFSAYGVPYVASIECHPVARDFCADDAGLARFLASLDPITDFGAFDLETPPDFQIRGDEAPPVPLPPGTDFAYTAPGTLQAGGSNGNSDRTVHFPFAAFPIEVGINNGGQKAFIGSQLETYTGIWPNSPKHYATHRFHDNYCEPRRWAMPLCGTGKGHQGNDIRPDAPKANRYYATAVADGTVTGVTTNTTLTVQYDGYSCRYLHLDGNSIRAAGIAVGTKVRAGQRLGKVSNIMGGKPATSIHLHFDCRKNHPRHGRINFPVYASLVAAYRTAWGIDDGVVGGALSPDACREATSVTGLPPKAGGADCTVAAGPAPAPPPAGACAGTALTRLPVGEGGARSLWTHNCSRMLLRAEGRSRSFVYRDARSAIAGLVAADPILFTGAISANGQSYRGTAKTYSSRCGVQVFDVEGPVDPSARKVTLRGTPPPCNGEARPAQTLVFEYFDDL